MACSGAHMSNKNGCERLGDPNATAEILTITPTRIPAMPAPIAYFLYSVGTALTETANAAGNNTGCNSAVLILANISNDEFDAIPAITPHTDSKNKQAASSFSRCTGAESTTNTGPASATESGYMPVIGLPNQGSRLNSPHIDV